MNKFVVIDLETTGHSPNDKIIEIGLVVIEKTKIVGEYTTLLHPGQAIPTFISNLTGITDEDVKDAPQFIDKANEITNFFNDSYLVAHNVPFDLNFLNDELSDHELNILTNPVLDTVELARILFPQAPGFKLAQLADFFQIEHKDTHRALSDAYVTAELFLILKEKLLSLPYETMTHLLKLEKIFHSDFYSLLLKQQRQITPKMMNHDDVETYNGLAFKHIDDSQEDHTLFELTSFGDFLDDIYESDGTMQREIPNYEKRPGQREMSEHIFDAFQATKHGLIEAETGTGKSLAYLIPAIYEAVHHHERIVISTYTTQLQSQLLEEEIPLVRKLISFPFKVALLKGKSHYISLERFARELSQDKQDNYDIALTKAMLLVWITETVTGDIDEIHLPTGGYYFFQGVSTEAEGGIDPQSPWFLRSYYQKARIKAQQADIIITNHALFSTDMFNEYKFLPSYEKAIIDEAHHLETTASRHYGLKLDYVTMQYTLNQLGLSYENNWLGQTLVSYPETKNKLSTEKWDDIFNQAKYEIDDLFRTIFQYVIDQNKHKKSFSDVGRIQYRFDEKKENEEQWNTIKEMVIRLTFNLRDLIHLLTVLDQHFEKKGMSTKFDREDLQQKIKSLQSFIDHLEQLFLIDHEIEQVRWIEAEAYGAKNAVYLYSEPADISTLLTNDLFNQKQSIILTSATLTMRNSFTYIQKRLGLKPENVFVHKIDSPFSYRDQLQLLVPNDFPDINNHLDDFIYSTCEAILSLAKVTKGRMLVLFTSYDMLRKSHQILKETMDLDEFMLIAQGISSGSRTRLKKNFQTFERSILLGTSSFWEGVDIPGDDLSCLMIVRLPFQPPNHPVYEATSAELKEQGKSAFFELALPHAVIRFKQGFGRLIRSANDRGIVFICDARILKARYGKFFTESIPQVPIIHDSTYELMNQAEEWF